MLLALKMEKRDHEPRKASEVLLENMEMCSVVGPFGFLDCSKLSLFWTCDSKHCKIIHLC